MKTGTADGGYSLGVHHISLSIPPGAEPQVRAFYGGLLGMREVEPAAEGKRTAAAGEQGGCRFRCDGDLEFNFTVESGTQTPRRAHPGVIVSNIDELAAKLTKRGVKVEWDDRFPGYRRFYAHDPLGNQLEFLQPVS